MWGLRYRGVKDPHRGMGLSLHPPPPPRIAPLQTKQRWGWGRAQGRGQGGAVLPTFAHARARNVSPCYPVVPRVMRLCCLSVCLCPPTPTPHRSLLPPLSSSPAPTSPGTFLFDLRSASHPPQLQPSPLAFPILLPFISLLPPVPAPAPLPKRCHGVGVGTRQGHRSVSRSPFMPGVPPLLVLGYHILRALGCLMLGFWGCCAVLCHSMLCRAGSDGAVQTEAGPGT